MILSGQGVMQWSTLMQNLEAISVLSLYAKSDKEVRGPP